MSVLKISYPRRELRGEMRFRVADFPPISMAFLSGPSFPDVYQEDAGPLAAWLVDPLVDVFQQPFRIPRRNKPRLLRKIHT